MAVKNKLLFGTKEFSLFLKKIAERFSAEHKEKISVNACAVIGIQTRGVILAQRIAKLLKTQTHSQVPVGILDITLYRDDVGEIGNQPLVKETEIPFSIDGKTILLVDDVLFTGRTVRAALDAILALGRPEKICLSVVIDRGNRELPIQPDYVGTHVQLGKKEEIQVRVTEVDKVEGIWLVRKK